MKKKTFNLIVIAIVVGIALLVGGIYATKTMIVKKDKASTISKEKLENTKELTSKEDMTILIEKILITKSGFNLF